MGGWMRGGARGGCCAATAPSGHTAPKIKISILLCAPFIYCWCASPSLFLTIFLLSRTERGWGARAHTHTEKTDLFALLTRRCVTESSVSRRRCVWCWLLIVFWAGKEIFFILKMPFNLVSLCKGHDESRFLSSTVPLICILCAENGLRVEENEREIWFTNSKSW